MVETRDCERTIGFKAASFNILPKKHVESLVIIIYQSEIKKKTNRQFST